MKRFSGTAIFNSVPIPVFPFPKCKWEFPFPREWEWEWENSGKNSFPQDPSGNSPLSMSRTSAYFFIITGNDIRFDKNSKEKLPDSERRISTCTVLMKRRRKHVISRVALM